MHVAACILACMKTMKKTTTAVAGESTGKKPRRFEVDWGRAVEAAGYTQVPDALIANYRKLGLSALDLCIVLELLRYWHKGKPCWLSKAEIARVTGVKPRSVQRRITAMHDAELIRREERTHSYGDSDTNLYHLDGLVAALVPYAKKMVKDRNEKREKQKPTKPGLRPQLLRVVA
jgi:hypothetical protein